MGISLTFQAVFLWIFRTIKYTASGPYALVFGLFSYFISDIPAWTRYRLFGIPLSFKSGFYIIALQLAFANVPGSIIASICGLAAGILFRAPCMPFRKFRLPKFLFSWLEKAKSNSLQTAHEMSRIPRLNEDAVKELKSMGFSEQDARSALSKAGNDLTRATHFLLDSDTHSHD